jgi:hypothetical protein
VLIKCATSTFCGNALRVLAIDSACSEDGSELWQEFFYLNSIESRMIATMTDFL